MMPPPLSPTDLVEAERIYKALDKEIRCLQSLHYQLRQRIRRSKAAIRERIATAQAQPQHKEVDHERLITPPNVTPSSSRAATN